MKGESRLKSGRKCVVCGTSYIPKNSKQKFCKDSCRKSHYLKVYFHQVEVDKVCLNCGDTFVTTCPKKQDYCKPECREENVRKRRENRAAHYKAVRTTYYADRYEIFKRDNFRCVYCGRTSMDGVALDIIEEDGKLKTACKDCIVGKRETVKND